MAVTLDAIVPKGTTFGNLKVVTGILDCADGAGEVVDSTLEYVAGFALTMKSGTTFETNVFTKSGSGITPTSGASGDTFYMIAFGV